MKQEKSKWKQLFGWDRGDWFWLIFFLMLFLMIYGYFKDTEMCREILKSPCDYCIIDTMNNHSGNPAFPKFNIEDLMNLTNASKKG